MKTRISWLMLFLIFACIIYGCSTKTKYERILKHELASGVRYDSLFMGLYLGMPQKDFYTQCWTLNRKGLIRQGSGNMSVEYVLNNELNYPGTMNFYPNFAQGKISEMPVRFVYKGWAPWNKKLSADNLQADILRWYKKVYGEGFIAVKHPKRGTAYVKLNGNRRISIYKLDDLYVWALFTDMTVKKTASDTISNPGNNYEPFAKDLEKK